jgi:hypothetical protein
MRLIAVLLLSLITAFWGVYAIILIFLPEGSPVAAIGVLVGAACLVLAGLYALATWGVAKRSRGLHITAVVISALGLFQPMLGQTWDVWALSAANLITLILLALTIPVAKPKA